MGDGDEEGEDDEEMDLSEQGPQVTGSTNSPSTFLPALVEPLLELILPTPLSFPPILSENLVRRRTRSDRDVDEGAGMTVWSLSEVELWGKLGPRCNHMTFFKSGLSVNYKITDSGVHSIHPEISCL